MSSECRCEYVHGASRSVVRQMGDRLPINTGKRLYIQLPSASVPSTPGMEMRYAATGERLTREQDGLRALSLLREASTDDLLQLEPTEDGLEEASIIEDEAFEEELGGGNKQMTVDKISALESELAKLKAQIAVYALAETRDLPSVPAPPPPPPPPPLSTGSQQAPVTRQQAQRDPTSTADERPSSTPARPPISDVLQGIGSVRLKTVNTERSPGLTPLRKPSGSQEPLDSDPASIIATALRKKFANRVFQDSPDKENLNQSELSVSEFDSPSTKLQFN